MELGTGWELDLRLYSMITITELGLEKGWELVPIPHSMILIAITELGLGTGWEIVPSPCSMNMIAELGMGTS